jgi:solute carrier family 12 (sodium/potassium/chloride transporter), member 2
MGAETASKESKKSSSKITQGRFGTFAGVFTPCVLTILGVIMFMRSGTVIGESGFLRGLMILLMAKTITTLTTLSLSAIATNTEVRTGGVYFMISRTLGPDFGGAIGLTLFVSQAISIAFYVIGFSEALFGILAAGGSDLAITFATYNLPQIVSTVMVILLFAVTFKGADVALKAQSYILIVLLLSVVSFLIGGISNFSSANFSSNLGARSGSGMGFWIVFAVFFPAATGITAGANMSGDLKNPAIAIPKGTILAIIFTAIIYLIQLVLLSGYTNQAELAADPFGTLKRMSVFGPLIIAGVFAATLSSALGSFLGAPRILQAMGQDRLLKPLEYFGVGHGPDNEPRRATILSLGIAVAFVWVGGLDTIAQVISMFFLIAYGMINLSAFVEGRAGNPSFRPRFKLFGWPAGLAGAIGCGYAMVKINETYAVISMAIAAAVYFGLKGRANGDWGDAKRGYIFSRTRQNLLLLERTPSDAKNWRPALAVLTKDCEEDRKLINTASWIESGRGILSVLELRSSGANPKERHIKRKKRLEKLQSVLHRENIVAFADSVIVKHSSTDLDTVLQSYSIGSLRPNTVMISVPPKDKIKERENLVAMMSTVSAFNLNVVIYSAQRQEYNPRHDRIDLWWAGQKNGSLMALFAYLTTTHHEWSKAELRILRIVKNKADYKEAKNDLKELALAARIKMVIKVVISEKPVLEQIAETSNSSDLVFLGFADRDLEDFQSFLDSREELLSKLPPTLLIRSTGDVDLLA